MGTFSDLCAIADAIFARLCHQDPSILMNVDGRLLPLCPRCLGLQMGFLLCGAALSRFAIGRGLRPTLGAAVGIGLALGPLLIDWGLGGRLGLYAPTTMSRLGTGLSAGAALAIPAFLYRQRYLRSRETDPRDLRSHHVAGLVGMTLGAGGLLLVIETFSLWILLALACVLGNLLFVAHTILTRLAFAHGIATTATPVVVHETGTIKEGDST